MTRLRAPAALGVVILLLLTGGAQAQATLTAPTVTSVTAGTNSLTVDWSAPADDGGSAVTSYDVRTILTSAPDKTTDAYWTLSEDAWSSGTLRYTVTGLDDGVGYDVQVRAVNATGDGPWSATFATTTTDHGDTRDTATTLAVGGSVQGRIDPSDEEDYFTIVLSSDADLWLYTTGLLDTVGTLYTDTGSLLEEGDDGPFLHTPGNFGIQREVEAGTYYLRITSYEAWEAGSYTLHARTVTDPGSTLETATAITLDSMTPGRLNFPNDTDFFKLDLKSPATIWMMGIGGGQYIPTDVTVQLLDSTGTILASDDDQGSPLREAAFLIQRQLEAGIYYIRVGGYFSPYARGPYTLYVQTMTEPGSSIATATPLELLHVATGRISDANDEDYFVLTASEFTPMDIRATGFGTLSLEATVVDDTGNEVLSFDIPPRTHGIRVWADLAPGTYYLRMTATGGGTGYYVVEADVGTTYQFEWNQCRGLTTSQSDPWYGCQWHLSNTGQFGAGGAQDINVEEVWATNKGEGVTVAVVDAGIQVDHQDLVDNIDTSRNHDYTNSDAFFEFPHFHGTSVAGLIAARDNSLGVRGVAPRASIYSLNLLLNNTVDNQADAMIFELASSRGLETRTGISNNSWGAPDTALMEAAPTLWEWAIERGITEGFGGKGILYVWAAGNGAGIADHSNLDEYANFYGVTAVCSVDYNDVKSSYSELGSNLWVCAPSDTRQEGLPQITTTDLAHRYTAEFGGTSAAAPIVSGVAALVRAANSELTWRDLKLILAASARRNDTYFGVWEEGALKYGSETDRYWFSHDYGFGVVDAGAAVALASDWDKVPAMRKITANWNRSSGLNIPDAGPEVTSTATVPANYIEFVEFVAIETDFSHSAVRSLAVALESPTSTESILAYSADYFGGPAVPFRFGSARHLGEDPGGDWTLKVQDQYRGNRGAWLRSWKITIYGHGYTPGYAKVNAATAGARSLTIDWDGPTDTGGSDITGYDLRYKGDGDWIEVEGIATSDADDYSLTGLGVGVSYDIQVRAVSDAGPGPWSGTKTGRTTPEVPHAPSVPTLTPRDGELRTAWTAPNDGGDPITRYDLRYIRSDATDKAAGNWTVRQGVWRTGGGDLEHTESGLANGVSHDVAVRAANTAGNSDWSTAASGAPFIANTDPELPEGPITVNVDEDIAVGASVGDAPTPTNTEGDTLQYSLETDTAFFAIDETTGQLTTAQALDYEHTQSHLLTVQVTDLKDSNGEADAAIDDTVSVIIALRDLDEPPQATGSTSVRYAEIREDLLAAAYTPFDPEGKDVTLTLGGPDMEDFELVPSGRRTQLRFRVQPNYEMPHDSDGNNDYLVTVTASDGTLTTVLVVTVTVVDFNEPPVVAGMADPDYREDRTDLVVARYSADDPDGDDVTWRLLGTDAGDFRITDGVLTFRIAPNYERPHDSDENNEYVVQVRAWDGKLLGRLDVTVTVREANDPPAFLESGDVGRDIDENTPSGEAIGDAMTAADDEGDTLTYSLGGADAASFAIVATSGQLETKAALDFEALPNTYSVTVRVSDRRDVDGEPVAETVPDIDDTVVVTITVTDVNEPPSVRGLESVDIAENSSGVLTTYRALDPEGVTDFEWSLSGTDASAFAISETAGSNGALSFAQPPDFDTPRDNGRDNVYNVTVEAFDGTRTGQHAVVVTVTNRQETPAFPSASTTRSVDEDLAVGQSVGAPVVASDGDRDALTYSLATPSSVFAIDPASGQLRTTAALDHETQSSHTVIVRVSDGKGADGEADSAIDDTITVTITVTDVEETPAFPSSSTTRTVDESLAVGRDVGAPVEASDGDNDALSYSLATPSSVFEIDPASGQLRTKTALDHETGSSYTVTVRVSDGKDAGGNADGAVDDAITVTITVTNLDEPGTVTVTPNQPQVGTRLTATLTDPDGAVTSRTWQWQVLESGDWFDVAGATSGRYTPVAADEGKRLRVTASYTDGHDSGKTATRTLTDAVQAAPVSNSAPEFPSSGTTRSVPENTPAGRSIGDPVEAGDDDGDDLTYTLGGTHAASFSIVETTGQLRTRAALDHEARSSYSVTVTATDRSGTSDVIIVTITVTDVEETPEFDSASTTRSVAENTPAGRPIGDPVAATDGDRDALTYSLGGSDAASFAIDPSSGRLRTRDALDFETSDSYFVTVSVSDRTTADGEPVDETDPDIDDTISVTIGVGDVEEAPFFDSASTTRRVAENTPRGEDIGAPVTATDDDGDALSYSLTGAGAASFAIDASSGHIETRAPLDFETGPNTYSVTVRVSDRMSAGGEPVADTVPDIDDSIAVTITVTNVNEAPSLSGRERINAREIATIEVTTYEAVDPEHDDLTWSLSGTDGDDFTISSTGELAFRTLPDFEQPADSGGNNVYQFTVQVSDAKSANGDPDPAIDATLDITVTVTNVGERGEITVSPGPARVGVTLTASLSDPDGGVTNLTWQWQISDNGASWSDVAGATSAGYTPVAADEGRLLRISAAYSDDHARATTAEATLADAVQSAPNTPPRFRASSTSRSVPENTAAEQDIGDPVAATDSDGDTLSYALGGADAAFFAIVAGSGGLRTGAALDFETRSTYSVSVSVSDGKNADGDDDPAIDDTISVTISVSDVNEPPAFPGTLSTALSVDENTPAGQDIGDPLAAGDEDAGSSLAYSLAGADADSFTIAAGGQLQTSAALDFETRGAYSLSVSVSDGYDANGDEDSAADAGIAITVTVTDLEEDGAISVPTDQPRVGTALPATLSDSDGRVTSVTWQWHVSVDQSTWSPVKTATSASYTPVADDESRYLRVTASYSDRRGSGKQAETSLPNPVQAAPSINRPPQFPAPSTSRSVPENTPRGEDIGTPIAAADNDVLRYSLSGTHASSFSIDQNTGQLRTNAALDYETRRSYSVTVTATDPSATSDSIAVTINVTDLNEPPAFPTSPRAPLSVDENTAAGRNIGSPLTAIDEDDGDSLIYSLDSASDAFFDIDPDKGLLRTEAPLNHEATDSYRVVVQVSDGDDAGGKPDPAIDDTLTLTVRVTDRNEPPVVSGEASISYAEDRTDPVATYAHNDPDENASITWSLSGPDAGDFAIDGSGVLSFAGPPDHDDPRDSNGDNEYHVTVSASDGSLRDSLDVTVTVSGVNERPQVGGPAAVSYREDRTDAVASYAHNDPDQPPAITWSLSGPDVRHFDFDDDSGELTFRETPDHEHARDANGDNDYQLTITASDGTLSDSLDVTVTVSDVNEPPTLTGRSNIPVDEHGDGFVTSYQADDPDVDAVLGWTVAGSDAGHFRINQEGELRFGEEPDFESPRDTGRNNVYNLTVRVFDGVNTPALNVTVPVRNVDEAGQVSVSSIQPQVGASLTAALKDPDGSITSQSWQWQSSTDRSAWSDIVPATTRGYTPVPTDEGIFLRVTVSYTDGHGPGKTATTVLDAVGALPAANARPTFPPTETGLRSIPENTPAGQPIGDPVSALDDSSDRLTYALDSAGDAIFDIVADTGQLLTDAPLDHEQPGSRTVTVTVTATDPSGARATLRVTITVEAVDEPPELSGDTVVSIPANSVRPVATYSAADPEGAPLIWRLEGRDAGAFDLVDGVLSFLAPPDFESPANAVGSNTYRVTIAVSDGTHSVTRDVAVVVIDAGESARAITGSPTTGVPISTGGGPSGPTPSDVDFEWTVTRDIEELDSGHDTPTGMWSDGRALWVAENGPGADDEIYAYDLGSGERLEDAEFELAETNRAPRGFWSDGEAVWLSDSGQDRLFAYELASGERLHAREFELARRNGDPRGLWSDGETVWVLDGGRDALFAYELASGVLLGEYALASSNGDPHGVWSDGVTVWVSDHGAKRLFAYRLPAAPEGPAADDADVTALERVGSEEFAELSKASNNSPRGLWSDGEVMYVADESDDRVYSYNMPDAIDARLASLTLSGVEIGEFSAATRHYGGLPGEEVTETTVEATAVQSGASVVVEPADADVETEGHQVGVDGGAEVTVTVTSPDGSRTRVYRVRLGEAAPEPCLRGDVAVGFSLLLYEGGSVDELVACAESRHVTTLYGGTTVPYVIGAPGFVNRSFVALFAAGLPAGTPLLATSEGPASPDPAGGVPGDIPPAPWPECLRGDGAPGFSLVLYEGGSVEELVECAASRGVSALYTLDDGEWVSYIAGAPGFVNRPFRELFAAGVPAVTPLLARGN